MSRSRALPPDPSRPPAADQPRSALDLLLADDAGHPLRKALWLDELDRKLRPFLPPGSSTHARLANLENGRLVFLVDGPVWHARVRLSSGELLDAARSLGLDAVELVVKTARESFTSQPSATSAGIAPPPTPLSAVAQQALREARDLLAPEPPEAGEDRGPTASET